MVGAGLSWGVKWVGCDQEFCFAVKLEISMRSPILSRWVDIQVRLGREI